MPSLLKIMLAATAFALPGLAFAAGSADSTPPKVTKTLTVCEKGQVYDYDTKKCVDAESSLIDDDMRYDAVRELAYGGAYDRAALVLSAMSDPSESRVMTYKGFLARMQGDMDAAMAFYAAALEQDTNNILARSYMGQAFVNTGETALAQAQLTEIRARGGRNTWAEFALNSALKTGKTFAY
ncbi:tetratricopeptide repeat protein [Litoreibacter roseus]|nr:tetratricopeptide repeat protein [Litoreibacter roseus]